MLCGDPRVTSGRWWPNERTQMAKPIRISGARDGESMELPQDLDALVIELEHGSLYIDLAGQVTGMVLMRAAVGEHERTGPTRLILSPMESWRIAVGVIESH